MKTRKLSVICSVIILISISLLSCANDAGLITNEDIYLSIPDIHFETKLIEQGIDSDGLVNQKILKTDAEALTRLDLNLSSNHGKIND